MGHWTHGENGPHYRLTKSEADFLASKLEMLLDADTRLRGANLATLRRHIEQMRAAPLAPPAPAPPRAYTPRRRSSGARSGPVVITRPDGSTETRAALTAKELREAAPERLPIYPALRVRVLTRDRQTCRYCLTTVGPFELDHVIPVAQGGATALWNLVTACQECNSNKGNRIWRPVKLSVARAQARSRA